MQCLTCHAPMCLENMEAHAETCKGMGEDRKRCSKCGVCLSAKTKPHEWETHWKTQGCQKRHEMQLRPQGAPGTGPATIGREGDQLDLDTAFFKADPHQLESICGSTLTMSGSYQQLDDHTLNGF